jgi:hypothetical protein
MKQFLYLLALALLSQISHAQHSIAREWNEKVLEAIRSDFARPTVHARNLFHTSAAMYDAWAVYEQNSDTYFLGKDVHGYFTPLTKFPMPEDIRAAQEEAISYAVYRLIQHRFKNSPRIAPLLVELDEFMIERGYNPNNRTLDYSCSPAGMGNYIAKHIIEYGLQDGSNEADDYRNIHYKPINEPFLIDFAGNRTFTDLNRWQPLEFSQFIDQSGTIIENNTPTFLSPEWGNVKPFSLKEADAQVFQRDGFDYKVYHDPGPPPYLNPEAVGGLSEEFKWGYALVAIWSSHLDTSDGVIWDISPAAIGNITSFPTDFPSYRNFYDTFGGGDPSLGHIANPKTGQPYDAQFVLRADYTRVLAEFWADGPSSETPPGHWFTILNYVNDHPDLVKKYRGQGEVLDDLEWDLKAYFILGGAMHDVAVTAWGIKGWYDFGRPVSAIRGMAEYGQSSDPNLPNYHPGGLPLIPGYIELIGPNDDLAGTQGQFIDELKIKAWKGSKYIANPATDEAGVDWIRATAWYPYQRPTFVTPPFAGYISGHSTFSRAAAEVLTTLTNDPFFPGGMGEFFCPKNEFLVFEEGPSTDVTLQWATYRDASDQCSLSRIWGGIHPPCDDIPGRLIGEKIGLSTFEFAEKYFTKTETPKTISQLVIYPNPTASCIVNVDFQYEGTMPIQIYQMDGRLVKETEVVFDENHAFLNLGDTASGVYFVKGFDANGNLIFTEKVVLF